MDRNVLNDAFLSEPAFEFGARLGTGAGVSGLGCCWAVRAVRLEMVGWGWGWTDPERDPKLENCPYGLSFNGVKKQQNKL